MPYSRRQFVLGGLALPGLARGRTPAVRPNVALLLVDYLPCWMLGCYGDKEVRTPHIGRLAQTGVRLLNHCAAAPAPGPGRACLLTGRTALQLKGAEAPSAGDLTVEKILGGAGYACGAAAGNDAAAVAAAALKFFDAQAAGKPFFFEAWFRGLTPPYSGVERKYEDLYAQERFESAFPSEPPAPSARQGKEMLEDLRGSLRSVAAAVTAIDDQIGAILARLAERRLLEDMLVVFASTCGALYGRHGLWGSADSSDPINMYQETVATPMIWSCPLRLPPQTTRPEGISACDFLPALCELTQSPPPPQGLCGRSYAPALTGAGFPRKTPWRSVVFSHLGNTDMVRDTRFKLVQRDGGSGPGELYNLEADPRERTNSYDDPDDSTVRDALAAELAKWRQSCSA